MRDTSWARRMRCPENTRGIARSCLARSFPVVWSELMGLDRNACGVIVSVATVFCCYAGMVAQSPTKPDEVDRTYALKLRVDEVVLTFNAMDANGLPINDLKLGEIRLWDNGVAPAKVVAFDEFVNRPIWAGVLMDSSESMQAALPRNKAMASKFLQQMFRQKSDAAFVAEFAYTSNMIQSWTDNVSQLVAGVGMTREIAKRPAGTAVFNAVYQACASSFGGADPTATGNFILLFSDGEDNAGLTSPEEAARACQRSNTQVFAFIPAETEVHGSTGPRTLRRLAAETGGEVFISDGSEETMWRDLTTIESLMRSRYRIVYKPANFRHDGAFHEILLQPPDRVSRVEIRSGYYAPRE
jgi:Ca-activated chloride channel homolog